MVNEEPIPVHQPVIVCKLGGHLMRKSRQEHALGVLAQVDLGRRKQAENASITGNQYHGFLRGRLGRFDPSVFSKTFNAYVRPHVE